MKKTILPPVFSTGMASFSATFSGTTNVPEEAQFRL